MGHIGLTPQSVHKMGGFRVQGKDLAGIEQLIKDAIALDRAGVFCDRAGRRAARSCGHDHGRGQTLPTIGIGAGPDCDGQVLVFHDILNLTFAPKAKFVPAATAMFRADQHRRAAVQS